MSCKFMRDLKKNLKCDMCLIFGESKNCKNCKEKKGLKNVEKMKKSFGLK